MKLKLIAMKKDRDRERRERERQNEIALEGQQASFRSSCYENVVRPSIVSFVGRHTQSL